MYSTVCGGRNLQEQLKNLSPLNHLYRPGICKHFLHYMLCYTVLYFYNTLVSKPTIRTY
jgi:hypothetical protein